MIPGENVAAFFRDFGVTAEFDGRTATVLFDQHDEDILHGVGQTRLYLVTFSASDFPTLTHGNSIVIDGESYQVQVINSLSDGSLRQARLFKP